VAGASVANGVSLYEKHKIINSDWITFFIDSVNYNDISRYKRYMGRLLTLYWLVVKPMYKKKGGLLTPPRMSAPQTCPAGVLILVIVGFFSTSSCFELVSIDG
jgi:hypothetical protein